MWHASATTTPKPQCCTDAERAADEQVAALTEENERLRARLAEKCPGPHLVAAPPDGFDW